MIHPIEDKLRRLAPSGDAETAWKFHLSSEGKERDEADELLDVLLYNKISKDYKEKIYLHPPDASLCAGEYELGNVCYPDKQPYCAFGLREGECIKHVLIAGMTGTGKTTLSFQILRTLSKHKKPFLAH